MRRIRAFALVASGILLSACTSAIRSKRTDDLIPRPSATGSRSLTKEMIAKWNVQDAYDAIERSGGYRLVSLKNGDINVSQRRGKTSVANANADRPVLLIDGTMMMDYNMLRQIRAASIERIDLLSPGDATQRFGTAAAGAGAIIVSTRVGDG
ncbi:MAG: TonB-dependent receptor plug domain-containing protein [Gemmatimonas sp.]